MQRAPSQLFLIFTAFSAVAGTSANYTLAPGTADGGGLRGGSASYTVNASATSGGAGASAAYTVRTGFAGQLLDTAALSFTAFPLTVNEEATRQLGATLLFDDATTASLAAADVAWSVESGPLAGISPSGLATAAAIYQDTLAVVRGSYQLATGTLGLTVLNVFPDNFEAYGQDGLPDDWQVHYFGVNNPRAAPVMDPDGDTWDNLFEYNAGLIPTDPRSTFSIIISGTNDGGHEVTFSPRFPDCEYTLLCSSDLALWVPVTGNITDIDNVRTILDPPGSGDRRFYYLKVLRR